MRRWFSVLILFAGFAVFIVPQEIVTAERYLEMVSDRYAGVKDYEAQLDIRSGNTTMTGTVNFLTPSFLRIDFARPSRQVLVFNGERLIIYLPEFNTVLSQDITAARRPAAAGASMASAQGLLLLRRSYIPAFVTGPEPTPLDTGSREQVVQLRLARRSQSEGFRELTLSINPDSLLIRRIEGRTIADGTVQFDFSNIRTNVGIPELRFIYDAPGSANQFNNFVFRDTD